LLKENPRKLQYTHQSDISKQIWYTWYLVNALDVYSTIQGLKYSCITEANPTLPKVPHRDHLIIHKTLLLSTVFNPYINYWSETQINMLNFSIGLAVINNIKLTNKAKNNPNTCPKR
jgi:hypothetical protein